MRRGFLLPKHAQKRSGVAQPAATSMQPSTEASELAGRVLSRHASHLAILLGDSSVLYLCRYQDRREAHLQRMQDTINLTYRWTNDLDIAMSEGRLPLCFAPPSAFILQKFPRLQELCFDEESMNSEPLFARRWQEMLDCLCAGLQAFYVEARDSRQDIDYYDRYLRCTRTYYDSNLETVTDLTHRLKPFLEVPNQESIDYYDRNFKHWWKKAFSMMKQYRLHRTVLAIFNDEAVP